MLLCIIYMLAPWKKNRQSSMHFLAFPGFEDKIRFTNLYNTKHFANINVSEALIIYNNIGPEIYQMDVMIY